MKSEQQLFADLDSQLGIKPAPIATPTSTEEDALFADLDSQLGIKPNVQPVMSDQDKVNTVMEHMKSTPSAVSARNAVQQLTPDRVPILSNIADSAIRGAKTTVKGVKDLYSSITNEDVNSSQSLNENVQTGLRGGLGIIAGVTDIGFSPLTGAIESVPGVKQTFGALDKYVAQPYANVISDIPAVQNFSMNNPNAGEVFQNSMTVAGLYGGGTKGKPALNAVDESLTKASTGIDNIGTKAKAKAVNDLEMVYDDLLSNQAPGKAKKYKKANDITEIKNKAGTEGTAPQRTLAESAIVPKIKGNKLDTLEQADDFRSTAKPLKETNTEALKEIETQVPKANLYDLEELAIKEARTARNIDSGDWKGMQKQIRESYEDLRSQYGDEIPLSKVDEIKSARADKAFGNKGLVDADVLKKNTDYAISKSMRKYIEETATAAGYEEIAQLNRHIGDILEGASFLEGLNGKVIRGGGLTKLIYGAVGSTVGTSALTKILAFAGGEAIATALMNLKISGPVRRMLLNRVKKQDPVAYTKALQWLDKQGMLRDTQLALPAPRFTVGKAPKDTSGIDKVRTQEMTDYYNNLPKKNQLALPEGRPVAGNGKTLPLPEKSASTISANETSNPNIKTPENSLKGDKLFGNKGNSKKYILGNGKFVSKDAETIIDLNKELSKTDRYVVLDDLKKSNPKVYKEVVEYENLQRYMNGAYETSVLTGKKKSLVQRIKDTPNKQGGFAKNPFVRKDALSESIKKEVNNANSFEPSAIKAKNIHPEDVEAIDSFITKSRLSEDISDKLFNQIEKLAEKWDISMDLGLKKVADKLEDILSGKTKVKGTLVPGSLK